MMNVESEIVTSAVWRRDVYGVLAFAYHRPPLKEDIEKMLEVSKFQNGLPHVNNLLGCCAQWVNEEDSNELSQDFNGLFMVPAGSYSAPYESVYTDIFKNAKGRSIKMTFGPSTRKVQAFYRKVGLQISSDYNELPDYIGLELACMEYLSAREAEMNAGSTEMENVRSYQKQFLTEHLVCWVPQLCQRIKKNSKTRFYRDLADLTREFVMHDEHRFG